MNRKDYHIGPGAASLLLIVVVLSMSALGMLALMNARSDYRLSLRSAEVMRQAYGLSNQAEHSLAMLDGVLAACAGGAEDDAQWLETVGKSLPYGMTLEGRTVSWTEVFITPTERSMACAVEIAPLGAFPRTEWVEHRLITELYETEEEETEEAWEIWF